MSHDPTHHPHRPGGRLASGGVIVPLPVRRAAGPAAVPTGRPGGGAPGDGSFTVDCADCAHRDTPCATTASSRSSSDGSRRTPWWSTPTRPGPCVSSSGPAWCPASATRPRPAACSRTGGGRRRRRRTGWGPRPCDDGAWPLPSRPNPGGSADRPPRSTPTWSGSARRRPLRRRDRRCRHLRRHPAVAPGPPPGRPARRHAVHLPQPGPLDRPRPDPGRGPVAGRRGLGLPAPGRRRNRRRRPGRIRAPDRLGRPLRPARPLRRHCRPRSTGSPTSSRPTGGGPGWWSTTTPWSTGPPPSGPDSAGTGATPSSSCPGSARGSSSARW